MRKTFIIAELAQGFEGDPRLVKKFIDAAKRSGADAVKFQIFKPSELCTEDYQYYQLFCDLEISPVEWKKLIDYTVSIGLEFMADLFGAETLKWIADTKISAIKIHSTDIKNYPFLSEIKNYKGKVLLSAGGSSLQEIKTAVELLKDNDLVLLPGFQAEPNQLIDVELDKVEVLIEEFGLPVGYADHLDANDSLAVVLPSMAVLKGATYIEKHLTFERNTLELEDSMSALNPDEFKQMVEYVEKVEQFSFTGKKFELTKREQDYRTRSKKIPVALNDITENTIITEAHLNYLRIGKTPEEILDASDIVGKKLRKSIAKNEPYLRGDLI
tara:strand:+ start:33270 stop:34253 length:984 start_codon:yes stop_codon:yes gene_type:complete